MSKVIYEVSCFDGRQKGHFDNMRDAVEYAEMRVKDFYDGFLGNHPTPKIFKTELMASWSWNSYTRVTNKTIHNS